MSVSLLCAILLFTAPSLGFFTLSRLRTIVLCFLYHRKRRSLCGGHMLEKKTLLAHQGIALFGRGFYLLGIVTLLEMRSGPNRFIEVAYSAERRAAREPRPSLPIF
jgi:hypothetical protein